MELLAKKIHKAQKGYLCPLAMNKVNVYNMKAISIHHWYMLRILSTTMADNAMTYISH